MAKKKTAEKNNLKVKKKSSFSFNEMPIVSIRKDKKIYPFEAGKMLKNKEF